MKTELVTRTFELPCCLYSYREHGDKIAVWDTPTRNAHFGSPFHSKIESFEYFRVLVALGSSGYPIESEWYTVHIWVFRGMPWFILNVVTRFGAKFWEFIVSKNSMRCVLLVNARKGRVVYHCSQVPGGPNFVQNPYCRFCRHIVS